MSDIPAYLGRTLNGRATDTAVEIAKIVREVMNRLASRGQTGASIRNIDVEAMELLTKQVNEACQFAFNLIGEVTPFVVEQVTFFAGRVEKIITDEVVPVATRLGMREDQAARVNATFLGQLRSRKEQLLDDFVHGMQGSERLKKDPVLNVIANQTNSPGATQQIGIGDKFTQSAFTQNHTELIAVIDRALESPEFAKLNTSQKEAFGDIAAIVREEAAKQTPDVGRLKRWGNRLAELSKDLGMSVTATAIFETLKAIFGG